MRKSSSICRSTSAQSAPAPAGTRKAATVCLFAVRASVRVTSRAEDCTISCNEPRSPCRLLLSIWKAASLAETVSTLPRCRRLLEQEPPKTKALAKFEDFTVQQAWEAARQQRERGAGCGPPRCLHGSRCRLRLSAEEMGKFTEIEDKAAG